MSARRAVVFFLLLLAGYALILPGQLATLYLEQAMIWVAIHLGNAGRWMLNQTTVGFPPGAAMAVSCVVLGTTIVALAVASASDPDFASVPQAIEEDGDNSGLRPAAPPLFAAALLAAATAYLCTLEPPTNVAVLTWAGSLLCGLLAFARIDRRRGTPLRSPFSGPSELAIVLLLTAVSLIVVTHDLMGWRWSGTPDESNFFGVAKAMAEGQAERFLLSERGVFEVHPTLSSAYQSLFMVLFGSTGFAWRLSSAVALAAALPALYLLARCLWNRRIAAVAALLFGTTPVAVGFAHLGYNNTQIYPVVLGSLALVSWARQQRSVTGYYLAGCVAGLGFYTYYPARLAPILVIWLGLCLRSFAFRGARRINVVAVAAALLLTVLPASLHPQETLAKMLQFTSFTGGGTENVPDLASAWQLLANANVGELARQTFMSLVYSVYFVGPHHFQWPPVVDPISGPLTLVGLVLCLGGLQRRNARFLAGTYVLAAVLVCGTSHYFRPPLTRLLFLSPFAALLAAIALDRLAGGLSRATGSPRLGKSITLVLTTAAVVWGIAASQYNIRNRYHGYGDGTTAELVRLGVEQPADTAFIYVQRVDTSMWSVDEIFAEYGMKERLRYMHGFDDAAREALETVQPPFLVALALGDESERLAAEAIMTRRFPALTWLGSDPEQVWNLRYCGVPPPHVP